MTYRSLNSITCIYNNLFYDNTLINMRDKNYKDKNIEKIMFVFLVSKSINEKQLTLTYRNSGSYSPFILCSFKFFFDENFKNSNIV